MTDAEKRVARRFRYTDKHPDDALRGRVATLGERFYMHGGGSFVPSSVGMEHLVRNGLAEEVTPEPAKPLCECGAEVAHPNHWFVACSHCEAGSKNTPICSACSELTCDERFLRHRALRHPEPKAERQWDIGSRVRLSDAAEEGTIRECDDGRVYVKWDDGLTSEPITAADMDSQLDGSPLRPWRLLPEPKAEKQASGYAEHFARLLAPKLREIWNATVTPECACLSASCSACNTKIRSDIDVGARTLAEDVYKQSVKQKALPKVPLYSPTAMMGGMWPVHGRK